MNGHNHHRGDCGAYPAGKVAQIVAQELASQILHDVLGRGEQRKRSNRDKAIGYGPADYGVGIVEPITRQRDEQTDGKAQPCDGVASSFGHLQPRQRAFV
jgi:hypothetical protein